ncbi:MAG: XRE family transcriptional regulator [Actinobacteria bacterium]|nr:MAG: XRE family transcriptional regulator [Actinomycetota bacterium]
MWNVEKGRHFKELRKKAGFSQKELARAMGYSTKQPMFYVESGRQEPSPKFRVKALKCFRERMPNVQLSDIFLD